MREGRSVFWLLLTTAVFIFSGSVFALDFHGVGGVMIGATKRAPAPEASDRQQVLPLPPGRGAGKWPKEFYQMYSRSQDGAVEDATFGIKFEMTPIREPGGAPDARCIQVKLKLIGDVVSNHRYYRDRVASYRMFNVGDGLPHRGDATRLKLKEVVKPKKDDEKGTVPVYIAIGKQPVEGELVVGCFKQAGNHAGKIELKAYDNSQEKMEIPWSFTWGQGDITNMRFHMTEVAAYDPESYMGERHPRRKITPEEKLERMNLKMFESSTYQGGDDRAPAGYYKNRFRHPDAERNDA